MNNIRLLIADDHPAFRWGVRTGMEQQPDFTVVGEAQTGQAALDLALTLQPDVLLLDLELPDLSGVEITQRLQAAGSPVRVLILSAHLDETHIFTVLENGAAGYLTKQEPLATIAEAVRGVAQGETGWLSRQIAALFVRGHRVRVAHEEGPMERMSAREQEVLRLLAHGLSNRHIGEELFISESTVKKHVNHIFEKISVRTRAQAVAWVWRNGLVEG